MAKSTGRREFLDVNIWVRRKSHTREWEEPFEWGDSDGTRAHRYRVASNTFPFFFGLSHSLGRSWLSHYSDEFLKYQSSLAFSSQVAGLMLRLCQSDCCPREGSWLSQERPSITWPTLPMLKQRSHTSFKGRLGRGLERENSKQFMVLQCSKILWGIGITLRIDITGYKFMSEKLSQKPTQQHHWVHALMQKSSLQAV